MSDNQAIDVVLLGSDSPFEGAGLLWKATEGEPVYRRLIHLADGETADVQGFKDQGLDVWTGTQTYGEKQGAPEGTTALLMVGQEGQPGYEEEFFAWMKGEHVPHLAAAPGNLYTAGFESTECTPSWFAVYYLKDLDVTKSDGWKLGQTPWRARMSTKTQNRVRGLYILAD